jgi:hypothetical protein
MRELLKERGYSHAYTYFTLVAEVPLWCGSTRQRAR